MLGSARTGESRIHDIFKKYGKETVRQFISEWFDYSELRMKQAISSLPKATIERESFHDPMPPLLPDGIPVRVKLSVLPDKGEIEIDLTSNIDNMDNGLNLSKLVRSVMLSQVSIIACLQIFHGMGAL